MIDNYEDAIIWLEKALAIDPKNVDSLSMKGTLIYK